jgi:co-chaperonin GroES (HSP10)
MKDSRYLEKFRKLQADGGDTYSLVGDYLLVERIPDEELKTATGIIIVDTSSTGQINTFSSDKPNWVRVLACGAGYYTQDEDENGNIVERTVPLDVKPGDIVLVSQVGVKYFSRFPVDNYEAHSLGLTKESEIQLKFHGEDGYRKAVSLLNSKSEESLAG